MTIHGSGSPIYLSQIIDEFGGWEWGNPKWLSWYYAGGPWVPAGTRGEWGAIPSSGYISLGHFYGASKATHIMNVANLGEYGYGYYEGTPGNPQGSVTPNTFPPKGGARIYPYFYWYPPGNYVTFWLQGTHSNDGWNGWNINGQVFNRADAVYGTGGGYTEWRWNGRGNPFGTGGNAYMFYF